MTDQILSDLSLQDPEAPLGPLTSQAMGFLPAMEPDVDQEARLYLSRHTEPSQELGRNKEGPEG